MLLQTYQTHTGLLVALQREGDRGSYEFVVSITGGLIKELLRTPDKKAATTYFKGLVKTYEEYKASVANVV